MKKRHEIGIRASRPFEILHMDITIFRTLDHTKVYIYFIVDNFSRAILNWQASTSYSSAIAMNVLKGAIEKHNINQHATLITDGGSENYGEVAKYIADKKNLKHVIAQRDIIQSNSMVEGVNKHMKYYYLFKKHLKNITDLINCLILSVPDYNDKPHGKIYGFTPNEVVNGDIPNSTIYSIPKMEARIHRIAQNKQMECCEK